MEKITSRKNALITEISKLKMKKYRDLLGQFIVEGTKLFFEAIKSGLEPIYVFVRDDADNINLTQIEQYNTFLVTGDVYEKITTEKSPQGILGVFCYASNVIRCDDEQSENENFNKINEVFKSVTNGYIIIENIQDTGNVGTIIRTALALGIDAVICVGCADIYNPKTLRASMGAAFAMKIVLCRDVKQAVDLVRINCSNVYAAALSKDSVSIYQADFSKPCAVMIGNEGNGLSQGAVSLCDKNVIIPISQQSESLNAGIAAAIFMEYMRGH